MADAEDQISITINDYETTSYDTDCESREPIPVKFNFFAGNGMVQLEESSSEYGIIKRSFLVGMGRLNVTDVLAVHKNSYSSAAGNAKLGVFRIFCKAVAEKRGGSANLKLAWYGGSRSEICDIVGYGFGRFQECASHGVGIHLSPANVPIDSALRAVEDENGVRHMLLCRVILGNTEIIPAGSKQSHPSSANFDSGIDNPLAPRKYIIWTPYMNSHIFPTYIISFRSRVMRLNSPRMKLNVLFNVLSRFLEPSKMRSVLKCYNDYRENKIERSQLILGWRSIVPQHILGPVIKFCRDLVN